MHPSLAKQDTSVLNVISGNFPVNEISRYAFPWQIQNNLFKKLTIVETGSSSPSPTETLQLFGNWKLLKSLAKQNKLL
jgi:hypothetical protein